MAENSGATLDDEIVFGEIEYANEGAEFGWTKGIEVSKYYEDQGGNPKTIHEALLLRQKRLLLIIPEYNEEVTSKLPDWKNASHQTVDGVVSAIIAEDDLWTKEIKEQTMVLEEFSRKIDLKDDKNIQIIIIKKGEGERDTDYAYLVAYPPAEGGKERIMDVSFPTALCHMIGAQALLADNEQKFEINDKEFGISINKIKPVSDEVLEKIVTETGRTPIDQVIQGALKLIDKFKGQEGQHIDPFSAWTNNDYAVMYALATHKGLGTVSNERINLPPLTG